MLLLEFLQQLSPFLLDVVNIKFFFELFCKDVIK